MGDNANEKKIDGTKKNESEFDGVTVGKKEKATEEVKDTRDDPNAKKQKVPEQEAPENDLLKAKTEDAHKPEQNWDKEPPGGFGGGDLYNSLQNAFAMLFDSMGFELMMVAIATVIECATQFVVGAAEMVMALPVAAYEAIKFSNEDWRPKHENGKLMSWTEAMNNGKAAELAKDGTKNMINATPLLGKALEKAGMLEAKGMLASIGVTSDSTLSKNLMTHIEAKAKTKPVYSILLDHLKAKAEKKLHKRDKHDDVTDSAKFMADDSSKQTVDKVEGIKVKTNQVEDSADKLETEVVSSKPELKHSTNESIFKDTLTNLEKKMTSNPNYH